MGLFPFRVEWVFSASKRDTQAVTTLMGDAKVELGDEVAISQETHVKTESGEVKHTESVRYGSGLRWV